MSVRLLGIAGRKGVGKDAAIRALRGPLPGDVPAGPERDWTYVQSAAVVRLEWAGEIKRCLRVWFGLADEQIDGPEKDLVDPRWGKTPREMAIALGDGVGRQIHPDTWVRWILDQELPKAIKRVRHRDLPDCYDALVQARSEVRFNPATFPILIAISGTRRENEVAGVRAAGGRVVRIVRPGFGQDDRHGDEIDALQVDAEVTNDGTVEELGARVQALVDLLWPTPTAEPAPTPPGT